MSNSPYTPEYPALPELPDIKEAGVTNLRLQGTLAKSLPPMPGGQLQDLYGSNYRAIAQAEEARDIGIASEINKAYVKRNEGRARAVNRMKTKAAENESRQAYKQNKRLQSMNKRRTKGVTRWFARDVLGVGPSLYR